MQPNAGGGALPQPQVRMPLPTAPHCLRDPYCSISVCTLLLHPTVLGADGDSPGLLACLAM